MQSLYFDMYIIIFYDKIINNERGKNYFNNSQDYFHIKYSSYSDYFA